LWELAELALTKGKDLERIGLTTNLDDLRILDCVKLVMRLQALSALPAGKPRTKVLFAYLK